tara:strand:- start:6393 stop:6806 length:414 start_codon:yes stop_codon:yes gene_type:complete
MQEISPLFILMKVEIITPKISNNREDSFWYWGEEIAKVKLENNHILLLDVSGDVKYLEGKNKHKNKEAIDLLMSDEYNYEDKDLDDLLMSGDISESNHFTIVELDESNNVVGECLGVCHEYDEAIEMLKELAFIDEE